MLALFLLVQCWSPRAWAAKLVANLQVPITEAWQTSDLRTWRDVQLWAVANSPPDALFATSLSQEGLRVYSKRSPVVEAKDGAPSIHARAYGLEWECRMEAVKAAERCLKER